MDDSGVCNGEVKSKRKSPLMEGWMDGWLGRADGNVFGHLPKVNKGQRFPMSILLLACFFSDCVCAGEGSYKGWLLLGLAESLNVNQALTIFGQWSSIY